MVATPEPMLLERLVEVQAARDAFTRFSAMSDGKLGRDAPNLAPIDDALKKIQQVYSKIATAKGIGGIAVPVSNQA